MSKSTRLERLIRPSMRAIVEKDKSFHRIKDQELVDRVFDMAKALDEKCSEEEAKRLTETKRR